MNIRTAILAILAVAVGATLAVNLMNRSDIISLQNRTMTTEQAPRTGQYISLVRKSDGRHGRLERRHGESITDFIQRAEDVLQGKVECWESSGVEWTVTTEPQGDEGQEALCERHDELVEELMNEHPKTGECEGL